MSVFSLDAREAAGRHSATPPRAVMGTACELLPRWPALLRALWLNQLAEPSPTPATLGPAWPDAEQPVCTGHSQLG